MGVDDEENLRVRCGLSKSHTARRFSCPTLMLVSMSMVADCWCDRVRRQGWAVAHAARAMGISRQCAHRWVARFDAEGEAGLVDRSSRPMSSPRRTPASVEAAIVAARVEHRRGQDWLGPELGVPPRTVSRVLRRHRGAAAAGAGPDHR